MSKSRQRIREQPQSSHTVPTHPPTDYHFFVVFCFKAIFLFLVETSDTDDDFQPQTVNAKTQWERWEQSTTQCKIYRLCQQQRNLRLNLRFGEFITSVCKKLKMLYNTIYHPHFLTLWMELTETEKNSYHRQVSLI